MIILLDDESGSGMITGKQRLNKKIIEHSLGDIIRRVFVIIPPEYKVEFEKDIYRHNLKRVQVLAGITLLIGLLLLPLAKNYTYTFMYSLLVTIMGIFILISIFLDKNKVKKLLKLIVEIFSPLFIILWGIQMSFLDGYITVYILSIIAISSLIYIKPIFSLLVFLIPHTLFLFASHYYLSTIDLLNHYYINGTVIVILGWVISRIFYKYHLTNFINKKIIKQSNQELSLSNNMLEERTMMLEEINNQLKISEKRYRTIFENTGTAMIIIKSEDIISLVNDKFVKLFGYKKEEVENKLKWTNFVVNDDISKLKRVYYDKEGPGHTEFRGKNKTGFTRHFHLNFSNIPSSDELVASLIDITDRKYNEEKIRTMAYHDPLTGLANRRCFQELFVKKIARAGRNGEMLSVLFLDLNEFKIINDTHGHRIADLVLCEVAERLTTVVRDSDITARFGGDEFVILLENIYEQGDGVYIAKRIIEIIKNPFLIEGIKINLDISIGLSFYPDDGIEAEQLISKADHAMYIAKRKGKERFYVYK